MHIRLSHQDRVKLGRAQNFVNDNSSNLCLVLFRPDNSFFSYRRCGIHPYGKKQMSDFYPEHEEFPHHGQDVETEETPSPYRVTDKDENIACII